MVENLRFRHISNYLLHVLFIVKFLYTIRSLDIFKITMYSLCSQFFFSQEDKAHTSGIFYSCFTFLAKKNRRTQEIHRDFKIYLI